MGYKDIIFIFKFWHEDRFVFPYIDVYMDRISEYLRSKGGEFEQEQLFRYMLVGFWLEYRACNHHGVDFTTDIKKWKNLEDRSKLKRMLEAFNELYNKPIKTSEEYLELLGCQEKYNYDEKLEIRMYNFVIDGKKMGNK